MSFLSVSNLLKAGYEAGGLLYPITVVRTNYTVYCWGFLNARSALFAPQSRAVKITFCRGNVLGFPLLCALSGFVLKARIFAKWVCLNLAANTGFVTGWYKINSRCTSSIIQGFVR